MSAGSPIIDPRVEGLAIVPIAPFRMNSRPLIVPAVSHIRIRILDHKGAAILILDGQKEMPVPERTDIHFTVSEHPARFVRFEGSFYKRIKTKLGS
jgi:NAD+ kinase